eukprot:gene8731-455_t
MGIGFDLAGWGVRDMWTPVKKPPGKVLQREYDIWNAVFAWCRARVERRFSIYTRVRSAYAIVRQRWRKRGVEGWEKLRVRIHAFLESINFLMQRKWHRTHAQGLREPVGPWTMEQLFGEEADEEDRSEAEAALDAAAEEIDDVRDFEEEDRPPVKRRRGAAEAAAADARQAHVALDDLVADLTQAEE